MKTLREVKAHFILETLNFFEGNRSATARSLGMSIRNLSYVLAEFRDRGVYVWPSLKSLGVNRCKKSW